MKTQTTPQILNSIKELEYFEKVSPKCSDKYVPIYTSKLVKELSKSFKFDFAGRYRSGINAHYAVLSKGKDVKLYIENSFDRSRSLRISFQYNRFVFGFIKQVHLGESASSLSEHYDDIAKLYENSTTIVDALTKIKFTEEEQLEIFSIVLKKINLSLDRIVNPKQHIDTNLNAIDFIDTMIDLFENGGLEVKSPKMMRGIIGGKTRISKGSKNTFHKITISKAIYDYIKEQYIEFYI